MSSGGEMDPSTHVLWHGWALCEDDRLRGVPRDWPQGQRWISLRDLIDGTEAPSDLCSACWAKAPALAIAETSRQIKRDS